MKKALLVVDVQNYFVVEKAKDIPKKIASYIEHSKNEYHAVLFAKFYNDPSSNFHKLLDFTEVTASPATDIHEALLPFIKEDNVFVKTTYSALKSKELCGYLDEHDIHALDICGISYDACVLATAFEAFDLGYSVEVLENLCDVSSMRDGLRESAQLIIERNLRKRVHRFKRE